MIIYKVTNKINGKIYIGQTTANLEKRRSQHLYDSKTNRYKSIFHRALRKYGVDCFTWSIIETCNTYEELDEMEFHYIMQYDSHINGYNMCVNTYCQSGKLNPNYGNRMSEETKNKLSIMAKNRYSDGKSHPWVGRKHTKESKEKMSKSSKYRRPVSEETRRKMSESQKKVDPSRRVFPENKSGKDHPCYGTHLSSEHKLKLSKAFSGVANPFYGKKHSEETKAKMREAWKNRKLNSVGDK